MADLQFARDERPDFSREAHNTLGEGKEGTSRASADEKELDSLIPRQRRPTKEASVGQGSEGDRQGEEREGGKLGRQRKGKNEGIHRTMSTDSTITNESTYTASQWRKLHLPGASTISLPSEREIGHEQRPTGGSS